MRTRVVLGTVFTVMAALSAGCGGSSIKTTSSGAVPVAQSATSSSSATGTTATPSGSSISSGAARSGSHSTHAKAPAIRAAAHSRAVPQTKTATRHVAHRKPSSSSGAQPVNVVAKAYEPKLPPGSMELTSAAFPGEGPIASQYTCTGADISPPLEWKNLPAKTAALIMVMTLIDNAGSSVRWVVGNIDPSPANVAEGKTPQGGVVGLNAEGHSNYAGICPPHGQASSVQVELFALSKKLSLSEGFQLSSAEHEYNSEKLLLGVTVAKAVNEHS
jgi:phosphatidylethanolamine-binding protein (PEBP) family uncharacterized protein